MTAPCCPVVPTSSVSWCPARHGRRLLACRRRQHDIQPPLVSRARRACSTLYAAAGMHGPAAVPAFKPRMRMRMRMAFVSARQRCTVGMLWVVLVHGINISALCGTMQAPRWVLHACWRHWGSTAVRRRVSGAQPYVGRMPRRAARCCSLAQSRLSAACCMLLVNALLCVMMAQCAAVHVPLAGCGHSGMVHGTI